MCLYFYTGRTPINYQLNVLVVKKITLHLDGEVSSRVRWRHGDLEKIQSHSNWRDFLHNLTSARVLLFISIYRAFKSVREKRFYMNIESSFKIV